MTRTALVTALFVATLAAQPAHADHPKKALKSFNGVSPEQFYRSSIARWADQLVIELAAAKAELAAAQVGPHLREAITTRADQAAGAASGLAKLAHRTSDRGQLYRAFAPVEAAYAELDTVLARRGALGVAFARAGYAYHQLSAAVSDGDRDQARGKTTAARLAAALDAQAQELMSLAIQHLGPRLTPDADRAIRQFSRAARRLHRDLAETGDVAKAGEVFPTVGQEWGEVAAHLARVRNLPDPVRAQAARIDGLYRRLGEKVAVILPPAGNPAPAPPVSWGPPRRGTLAVAAGEGGGPRVRVFADPRGPAAFDFFAFDAEYRGGVRVAVADLNGDGVPDVVAAPGKDHPPLVRVFDGNDMGLLAEFYGADPQWTGGLTVAAADLTRDGRALVAVAPDAGGGPVVRVFDLAEGKEVATVTAFDPRFRGGVRVAWADPNADGNPELVAAPGPGELPPVVRVFDLADPKPKAEFPAFDRTWRGGLWVAAAGGRVVCGLDAGGPPVVRVFDLSRPQKPVAELLAFAEGFRGGVRVAVTDGGGGDGPDTVAVPGPGLPNVPVVTFSGRTGRPVHDTQGFQGFEGGGYVGGR